MAGIAIAGRIPRLVRDIRYHLAGLFISVVCWVFFYYLVRDETCYWLAETIPAIDADPRGTVVAVAAFTVFLGYLFPLVSDRSGSRLVILVGALAAVGLAMAGIFSGPHGNIFPVLLSGAIFVYLWWLAVIILDITFIWHRYIRNHAALDTMRECAEGDYERPYVSSTLIEGTNPVASAVQKIRRTF